jgi:hypothetical protein
MTDDFDVQLDRRLREVSLPAGLVARVQAIAAEDIPSSSSD